MTFANSSILVLMFDCGSEPATPTSTGDSGETSTTPMDSGTPTVPGTFVDPAPSTVAYVTNLEENTISEISLVTGEVVDTIGLPPTGDPYYPGPVRVAASVDGSRIVATSGYQVHVVETSTNEAITFDLQNIGPLAFSPTPDVLLLFDRFRGAVVPFDLKDPDPLESLDDNPRFYALSSNDPEGWDLHPVTNELFVPDSRGRTIERFVAEVSLGSLTEPAAATEAIETCTAPSEIVVASTDRAYVACPTTGTIEVVDLTDGTREPIPDFVAERASFIELSPDESVLAVLESRGRANLIDLRSGARIGRRFDVGPTPYDVAFTPDSQHAAVVSREGRLTVIHIESRATVAYTSIGGTSTELVVVDKGTKAR